MERNGALATIGFPALTTVGQYDGYSIGLHGLPNVSAIALPQLRTTSSTIALDEVGGATPSPGSLTLDFGALTSVGGGFGIDHVHNLVRITEFSHLASVNGEFGISVNDALTELPPPVSMVTITGSLHIVYNAPLPTCTAKTFAMSVSGIGPAIVTNNKADACGG